MPADWFLKLGEFKLALLRFMAGKRIAFVGGVAMRVHGARPRATEDYDLLIDRLKHLKEIHAFILSQGALYTGNDEFVYFYYFKEWKLHIDVLLADSKVFKAALEGSKEHAIKGIGVRVVQPLGMAAMKVLSYRDRGNPRKKEQDLQDLLRLLRGPTAKVREADVAALLQATQPELIPVLRQVLGS